MNEIQLIVNGEWPDANLDDVQALLLSIIRSYMGMVGRNEFESLLIINQPNRKCPRALYERNNGSICIYSEITREK